MRLKRESPSGSIWKIIAGSMRPKASIVPWSTFEKEVVLECFWLFCVLRAIFLDWFGHFELFSICPCCFVHSLALWNSFNKFRLTWYYITSGPQVVRHFGCLEGLVFGCKYLFLLDSAPLKVLSRSWESPFCSLHQSVPFRCSFGWSDGDDKCLLWAPLLLGCCWMTFVSLELCSCSSWGCFRLVFVGVA